MNGNRQGFWIAMVAVVAVCAALITSAFADQQHRDETKMFDEQFSLEPGGRLDIDVEDIDVDIKKTSGKSRVQVFVRGKDEARAVEYFNEHMRFEATLDGNTLTVVSKDPRDHDWRFWNQYKNISVRAVIEVPVDVHADIRTEDGDVDIEELNGELRLKTEDGDIFAPKLSGPSINISSEDGDIRLGDVESTGDIDIETQDGDFKAEKITSRRLQMSTSDGDVRIERIKGDDIMVSSADGDIEIGAEGGKLTARCADGDLTVRLFGNMEVDISTADGDIDLRVPGDMGAELELLGEDVHVSGGLRVNGRVSDHKVVGSINDGGKRIRAKTNDGNISIRSN